MHYVLDSIGQSDMYDHNVYRHMSIVGDTRARKKKPISIESRPRAYVRLLYENRRKNMITVSFG